MEGPQGKTTLFVNRSLQKWILLDQTGKYWILPGGDHPWDRRQPYQPMEEIELELVPGHYKDMLGIPPNPRSKAS